MSYIENAPCAWWFNTNVAPDTLSSALATDNSRLVSLSVRSVSPKRLTAVWAAKGPDDEGAGWDHDIDAAALEHLLETKKMRLVSLAPFVVSGKVRFAAGWVPNSGSNAIASWWHPDVSHSELEFMLKANSGRLICFSSYVISGERHHCAVWVDNTGPNARKWWWTPKTTAEALGKALAKDQGRLISLDPFTVNGELRFGAVWVHNVAGHAKGWWWYFGKSGDELAHKFDLFGCYAADLQVYSQGGSKHLACVMYGYPQPNPQGSDLIEVTASAQLLKSYFNDGAPLCEHWNVSGTIKNKANASVSVYPHVLNLTSGGWVHWEDSAPNAYKLFDSPTPIQIPPLGHQDFDRPYDWGMGVHNVLLDLRAESGGQKQHLHHVVPIVHSGFPDPPPVAAPVPVYAALLTNPAEVVELWNDGKALWISAIGMIVNNSGGLVRLAAFHMTLEIDGETLIDQDLDLALWSIGDKGQNYYVPIADDGAASLAAMVTHFCHGFILKGVSKSFQKGTLKLSGNYKVQDYCASFFSEFAVKFVTPATVDPPVGSAGSGLHWIFGSGPNHDGPDCHQWLHERFAYDVDCQDEQNNPLKKKNGAYEDSLENSHFHSYGKPIYAIRPGSVVDAHYSDGENDGSQGNGPGGQNYVVVLNSDGSYDGYYHLRQCATTVQYMVKKNQTVAAGQKIGEIGNAGGSSGPHLHFQITGRDATGRGTCVPLLFKNLKTMEGDPVTATPGQGNYKV